MIIQNERQNYNPGNLNLPWQQGEQFSNIENRKKGQGTKDKEGDQLSRDETVRRKVRTLTKARFVPVETETAPNPNTKQTKQCSKKYQHS